MRKEGCFPFISWFDSYIVVPPSDVKFGEEGALCQAIDGLGNEWHGVSVFPRPFVDGSVVLYWS